MSPCFQHLVAGDAVDHDIVAVGIDRPGKPVLGLEDGFAAELADVGDDVLVELPGRKPGFGNDLELAQQAGGGLVGILQAADSSGRVMIMRKTPETGERSV